jgi:hypothetical protein
MPDTLIGRKEEQTILLEALHSESAEMVAIFGRRRVGKTFLIKQTYQEHIAYELTGLQSLNNEEQLQNFSNQLEVFSQSPVPVKKPTNWLDCLLNPPLLRGSLVRSTIQASQRCPYNPSVLCRNCYNLPLLNH